MTDEQITISIPVKEAASRHIEGLQATLTKRNAEIERLVKRVEEAESGEPNQDALGKAYKRGWQGACDKLIAASGDAARALGKLQADAWEVYLEAERMEAARIREQNAALRERNERTEDNT